MERYGDVVVGAIGLLISGHYWQFAAKRSGDRLHISMLTEPSGALVRRSALLTPGETDSSAVGTINMAIIKQYKELSALGRQKTGPQHGASDSVL